MRNGASRSYCSGTGLPVCVLVCVSLLCWVGSATAVKCFSCEQDENTKNDKCMGATCEGEYCFATYFRPRIGSNIKHAPVFVKGCVGNGTSGPLLRKGLADSCATFDDVTEAGDTEVTFCTCSHNWCNRNEQKLTMQKIPLTRCLCEGEHCGGEPECNGQYCTHVSSPGGNVERGCLNESTPLLIGEIGAACILPPMLGGMHYNAGKDIDIIRQTLTCICKGEDYCNAEKPKPEDMHPETEICETEMRFKLPMMPVRTTYSKKCKGQYCYKAGFDAKKSISKDVQSAYAEGCITFTKNTRLDSALNPTGSMNLKSEQVDFKVLYTSVSPLRRPARKARNKKPPQEPAYLTEKEEEEEEDEQDEDRAGGAGRLKAKGEDADELEDAKGGKGRGKSRYVVMHDTPPPPLKVEEGNTTLVAIFVVLMLAIVVSGVVWKFELHKKVFRARYETVAG